jgi:HSP20 family protein
MSKTLATFDPLGEMRDMGTWMDRFFGFPAGQRDVPTAKWSTNLSLPVDIYERDNNLVIKAAIPGVNAEDVDIQIEDHILTIRGETKQDEVTENDRVYRREYNYGAFTRSIRLPENVNVEQPEATFDKGFVYVTLPKIEEQKPKALKVPVKSK